MNSESNKISKIKYMTAGQNLPNTSQKAKIVENQYLNHNESVNISFDSRI